MENDEGTWHRIAKLPGGKYRVTKNRHLKYLIEIMLEFSILILN